MIANEKFIKFTIKNTIQKPTKINDNRTTSVIYAPERICIRPKESFKFNTKLKVGFPDKIFATNEILPILK